MGWMGGVVAVPVTALAAAAQQPAPAPGAYAVLGLDDVTVAAGARHGRECAVALDRLPPRA